MPAGQTIDQFGCLTDDRYPGVIFGREHSTRWAHIELRSVAQYNGRSVWGYMLRCKRCGAESIATVTTSVAYEDAPGRFAHDHTECLSELAARFPDHTHYMDGVELHTFSPDGAVMWCSDWARIWDLPLRREYGGPETYGHVTFYMEAAS